MKMTETITSANFDISVTEELRAIAAQIETGHQQVKQFTVTVKVGEGTPPSMSIVW